MGGKGRRQVGHSILMSIHRCRQPVWKKWSHGVTCKFHQEIISISSRTCERVGNQCQCRDVMKHQIVKTSNSLRECLPENAWSWQRGSKKSCRGLFPHVREDPRVLFQDQCKVWHTMHSVERWDTSTAAMQMTQSTDGLSSLPAPWRLVRSTLRK